MLLRSHHLNGDDCDGGSGDGFCVDSDHGDGCDDGVDGNGVGGDGVSRLMSPLTTVVDLMLMTIVSRIVMIMSVSE